jgi:hypothetical protein
MAAPGRKWVDPALISLVVSGNYQKVGDKYQIKI